MGLESTNLGNWTANEVVSNADQISSYVASSFVHLSGDLINGDLIILNGNFIQSDGSALAYSTPSFILGIKHSDAYGPITTGSKGNVIIGINVDNNNKKIKLSGDITCYEQIKDLYFSIALGDYSFSRKYKISEIDTTAGIITLDLNLDINMISALSSYTTEQFLKLYDEDDNAFYCPAHTEIGNIPIKNFFCQHAEGGSTRSIGKYSHAEGRYTIADGRYSHAEGHKTCSGGLASHAEGFETEALGLNAHAEGHYTKANGEYSHSEGHSTTASGDYSHTENLQCLATGLSAHAQGEYSYACGKVSFAAGDRCNALSDSTNSIVFGVRAISKKQNLFVWNSQESSQYPTNDNLISGTFNINPSNGIDGFYVGDKKISDALSSKFIPIEKYNEIKQLLDNVNDVLFDELNGNKYIYVDLTKQLENNNKFEKNSIYSFKLNNPTKYTSVYKVNEIANNICMLSGDCFRGCSKLIEITASNVLSIGSYCFSGCNSLSSVYLPNVKYTELAAFQSTKTLSALNLPSIEYVGSHMVSFSTTLTSLSIPNAIRIESKAFLQTSSLRILNFSDRNITLYPTIPVVSNSETLGFGSECSVIVPDSMYDNWIAALHWNAVSSQIHKASEMN